MSETIIVKPSVAKLFEEFLRQGRVLFFNTPLRLRENRGGGRVALRPRVLRLSGDGPTLSLDAPTEDWEILLIDDFQQMQSETEGQTLCELIRFRPDRRFVILSRGAVPGYFHIGAVGVKLGRASNRGPADYS